METVIEIVTLIRARALNHRRFQNHLASFDAEYDDRQKLLCNLYKAVKGFDGKLSLLKVHAESGNFPHFRFTREACGEDEARMEDAKQMLVGVLDSLQTAFNKRFVDIYR